MRPYYASVNSHFRGASQSAVIRRWLTCVLCDRHIHNDSEQISFIMTMLLPILQLSCRLFFFGQSFTSPRSGRPNPLPTVQIWLPAAFSKTKITVEIEICESDAHSVHKVSQRRLTADWLAPRESDCSRVRSKVSSDWLPSYIKVTYRFSRYSKWTVTYLIALVQLACYCTWRGVSLNPNREACLLLNVYLPLQTVYFGPLTLTHSFKNFCVNSSCVCKAVSCKRKVRYKLTWIYIEVNSKFWCRQRQQDTTHEQLRRNYY
jgi:hypothetical protein